MNIILLGNEKGVQTSMFSYFYFHSSPFSARHFLWFLKNIFNIPPQNTKSLIKITKHTHQSPPSVLCYRSSHIKANFTRLLEAKNSLRTERNPKQFIIQKIDYVYPTYPWNKNLQRNLWPSHISGGNNEKHPVCSRC